MTDRGRSGSLREPTRTEPLIVTSEERFVPSPPSKHHRLTPVSSASLSSNRGWSIALLLVITLAALITVLAYLWMFQYKVRSWDSSGKKNSGMPDTSGLEVMTVVQKLQLLQALEDKMNKLKAAYDSSV